MLRRCCAAAPRDPATASDKATSRDVSTLLRRGANANGRIMPRHLVILPPSHIGYNAFVAR
jgi:hypothetical protein